VAAVAPERASVLGPHPCVIERIRNQYRHEVLLRAADAMIMREILDRAREGQALKVRGASVMLDVDPVALT
jgi:primosomal protein N'